MARGSSTERKTSTTLSSNIVSVLNSPATSSSPSPEPSPSMVGRKSTMRRSPQDDITMPITYTPTTHRISKAKKGKRVHACEFPGCNKVCAFPPNFNAHKADSTFHRSSLAPSTADAMN